MFSSKREDEKKRCLRLLFFLNKTHTFAVESKKQK